MSDKWFLVMRGKDHGPYTFDQLRDMHFQGMLQADSELKNAAGEIQQATAIPGLFDKVTEQVAAAPAVAEVAETDAAEQPEASSASIEAAEKTAEEEKADEFGVYSSEVKEPGIFQWSDFLTPKVIVVAMGVIAYLIYVSLVTDHYVETQGKAQKRLQQIEAQQRMYEQLDGGTYDWRNNVDADQIGEAMRQSSGY